MHRFLCSFLTLIATSTLVLADEPLAPGFGGQKPEPSAFERLGIDTVRSSSLVIAHKKGSRLWYACSLNVGGGWDRYVAPPGVEGTPVLSNGVAAIQWKGESIREVVAFSPQRGKWSVCKLDHPATESAKAIVSNSLALFIIDGRAYAFSPQTGTWDDAPCNSAPSVDNTCAIIEDSKRLGVFTLSDGRWSLLPVEQLDEP